jgi:hypothetical protein
MPITHTNRKGITYTLYQATTAAGRARYVFAREPHGEPVETLPAGYVVRESVNGVVSLARDRPAIFTPEEVAAVQAALRSHPKAALYRVEARPDHIAIHERLGPEADDLAAIFREVGLGHAAVTARIEQHLDQAARYTPVLRFRLQDRARRLFGVERRAYLGGDDEWLLLEPTGPIEDVARQVVPLLGTAEFFELW